MSDVGENGKYSLLADLHYPPFLNYLNNPALTLYLNFIFCLEKVATNTLPTAKKCFCKLFLEKPGQCHQTQELESMAVFRQPGEYISRKLEYR